MDQFDEIEDKIDRFINAVYHILWRIAPLGIVILIVAQIYLTWRR